MTQLTAADSGYVDPDSYTSQSTFYYNANAFGKNVSILAERFISLALLARETPVNKTNPFSPLVDGHNVKAIAHVLKVDARGNEIPIFKINPFDSKVDRYNVKARADVSLISQLIATNSQALIATKTPSTGVTGERQNVKQQVVNESDSVVKKYKSRPMVWGLQKLKALKEVQ